MGQGGKRLEPPQDFPFLFLILLVGDEPLLAQALEQTQALLLLLGKPIILGGLAFPGRGSGLWLLGGGPEQPSPTGPAPRARRVRRRRTAASRWSPEADRQNPGARRRRSFELHRRRKRSGPRCPIAART